MMFCQMCQTMKLLTLNKGHSLYAKGDDILHFYFVLEGAVQVATSTKTSATVPMIKSHQEISKSELLELKFCGFEPLNERLRD